MSEIKYDVFISHASEDKEDIVHPLADKLKSLGVKVWYDAFELKVGDSLSRSIDNGLANSTFGVVIISPSFLRKNWPEYELRGLVSKEIAGEKVILPVWHNVSHEDILRYSPTLADKLAINTTAQSPIGMVRELVKVIRPDIHEQFLRTILARTNALKNLKEVPLDKLQHGDLRHPSLPQELVSRIISIHAMTEEVLPIPLAETLYSFQCDSDPEREVRVWERIVACYYLTTTGESLSVQEKKDIFAVLLGASMGPLSSGELAQRQSLTREELDSIVELYDSDLSYFEMYKP